jgi:hypothetical protein
MTSWRFSFVARLEMMEQRGAAAPLNLAVGKIERLRLRGKAFRFGIDRPSIPSISTVFTLVLSGEFVGLRLRRQAVANARLWRSS